MKSNSDNLVARVLSYPPYGVKERRAGRREPWERGWNSDGGTDRVEQGSGTVMVEQSGWNSEVEQ